MKFNKRSPGRVLQLWLGWIAIAYFSTSRYPVNIIGLSALFIFLYVNYSKISYPIKLQWERIELHEISTFPQWIQLTSFLAANGFALYSTMTYEIMRGAEVTSMLFWNKTGVMIRLDRQVFLNKSEYALHFKTFFKDGLSVTTTNYHGNEDFVFKEKHPVYQIYCSSYDELFLLHKNNVPNHSKGRYIETDPALYLQEFLPKEYSEKIENMVSLGFWRITGDRCRMTFKGKLRAFTSYYNFLPLFQKTRIV